MRVFLYGTLLRRALLDRLAGRAVPTTPAAVAGWQRVAMRGGAYPTLRRGRGRVAGCIATVDAPMLRRLGGYEGARYRLRPLTVQIPRGAVRAHAWIADAATRRPWP
ncbi:MAG: gamma-glutamylcyclotransferase [Alphaproteobacteria bacterium]|nr:gamma-glutamylcyclotransferase [Alphaproteobacteria bacterium]